MKRLITSSLLLLLISIASLATTVERLTLDDMVKKAHAIVHGKVRSSRAHWSADGKLILTTTTIEVQETIKGQPVKTIELTTVGGQIGDLTMFASGMPAFETGEDAVVFVENTGAFKTVVGLSQGKFSVKNGEVSNRLFDLSFPDGREGGPPLKMHLQDFKREIKNRLN